MIKVLSVLDTLTPRKDQAQMAPHKWASDKDAAQPPAETSQMPHVATIGMGLAFLAIIWFARRRLLWCARQCIQIGRNFLLWLHMPPHDKI